ncbi:bifunctional diaminohydroxyphosphoribosylaminopyrimidine deaminase/5-amino-6-(5-phosphoribosylamino)uracil reductase RibD [Helicobacter burdigaliensis]
MEFCFDLILKEAWKYQALTLPNPAVGALILDKFGKILSLKAHKQAGKPHAEILALQEAYYKLSGDKSILSLEESKEIHKFLKENAKNIFKDCTLYVTLEPCLNEGKTPSCAKLLAELSIKEICIATQDVNKKARGGAEFLENLGMRVIKAWEIKELEGIHKKAKELLIPFARLQKKGAFVLFKYASRLNGSIDGGQISSPKMREFMHNLRSKVDSLLISGKTIREDNPILDVRFATLENKKNPDINILTRMQDFPKTAPLFSVPAREVNIISKVPEFKGFVFCEGGSEFFKTLKPYCDLLLVLITPKFSAEFQKIMQINADCKILHTQSIGEDLALWLQIIN